MVGSEKEEDWRTVLGLLPTGWEEMARKEGALKNLRVDKSAEGVLRMILMHCGCGYSLRETVARAEVGGILKVSDVGFLKRMRKSEKWLQKMCMALFKESQSRSWKGGEEGEKAGKKIRIVDGTTVKEAGKTGSLWRIHYSMQWPSMECDFFKVTPTQGEGCAESLKHFSIEAGEHLLADRGYSHSSSIYHVAQSGAYLTLRLNPAAVRILDEEQNLFLLREKLQSISKTHEVGCWKVCIGGADPSIPTVSGRLCVLRKDKDAIAKARKRLRRRAQKNGTQLQADTLFYAEYILIFTTFDPQEFPPEAILEWYRLRWQIELVFKRAKQLAQLGHLPKRDPRSSRAWLYGKLFLALLTEKLLACARSFSPWGYPLYTQPNP